MNDTTNHIYRRSRAIDRLRSVTTGAAVAGIAGTVGFGALAAATWSGHADATSATRAASGAGTGSGSAGSTGGSTNVDHDSNAGSGDDGSGFFGTQPGDAFGTVPNDANQNPSFVRPAQPGSQSHATSGGSH